MNEHPLILTLDVDGVAGGFVEAVIESLHRHGDRRWVLTDFPDWEIFDQIPANLAKKVKDDIHNPGFCAGIKPFAAAQHFVDEMRRTPGVELHFATTPWTSSRHWQYERHHWLIEHFQADKAHIAQLSSKHLFYADVFVDDKVPTVLRWHAHWLSRGLGNVTGVVWDTPHNQRETVPSHICRTKDWNYVRHIVHHKLGILPQAVS